MAALVAALSVVAASAAVGGAKAGGYTTVSQGIGSSVLNGYTPFANTDPSTPETVSLVLRANNINRLEALVSAGMPTGYVSVRQFAQQYGQSPFVIAGIEAYLGKFGIHATAMQNNLVIQTTGTAGQYDQAFQVSQQNYDVSAPKPHGGHHTVVVHGTKQNPKVPSQWGPFVLAVLGLSSYPTQQSEMAPLADGVKPQSQLNNTALFPNDFAQRYDLSSVQAKGTGAGRTIGIVTLASVKPQVVSDFWSYIGLTGNQSAVSRITPVDVDGGAGPASSAAGSDETALDAEQSGALAPNANVRVYQAPNTDYGFVDAFFQAASDNLADSVSASWGESESVIKYYTAAGEEDPNYTASFDEAFLELAAQGQSTFLSSGDEGAYPASRDLGSTDSTSGNPDDSPWVTSSGGTTLPGSLTLHGITFNFPSERTWGWDYLWASPRPSQLGETEEQYAENEVVGGGGGYSEFEPMPAYQKAVGAENASTVEYLTPTDYATYFGSVSLPDEWMFNPDSVRCHGAGHRPRDAGPLDERGPGDRLSRAVHVRRLAHDGRDGVVRAVRRHELRRAAVERHNGSDRLGARSPRRFLEPVDLQVRRAAQLAVHAARPVGHVERQPALHRHARCHLQRGVGTRSPRLRAARAGLRALRAGTASAAPTDRNVLSSNASEGRLRAALTRSRDLVQPYVQRLANFPNFVHDEEDEPVCGPGSRIGEGMLEIARHRGTTSGRLGARVSTRRALRLAFVLAAVAALAAVTATSKAQAGGKVGVSQGLGAAVLPSSWFGNTPSDTPESVSFILQAHDLGRLEAQVSAGMPGGFLSVSDFARRYGQPQQRIAALEGYLGHYGITTHAMPDGLDVQATGTAGQFDSALTVQQHEYHVPAVPSHNGNPGVRGGDARGTTQTPLLPRDLASFVLAVLGLTNWPTMQSNMIGVPKNAQPKSLPNTALLPGDFAKRYGLDPVYATGGTGHGRTIGIVTLASVDPNVVSQFWSDTGLTGSEASASRITRDNVDGGAGPVNEAYGSDETSLDAEQSGALAPDAI